MKRVILIMAFLAISVSMQAQNHRGVINPLDLPISFSGTYGELRHDHFHAGLDFRTGGQTGFEVHAIKDGYVSRVTVSVTGYGNGIYVAHNDGTMSVYGHLSSFAPEIAERVVREQYSKESFAVSLSFSKNEFPVKQGDVIGRSGNTGSSAGPHLHMEIREQNGEIPINYLARGVYDVEDAEPPVFQRVAFYGYEDSLGVVCTRRVAMLYGPSSAVIKVPRKSYVAIDAVDKMNGTAAKLAVDQYRVLLDGKEIFCLNIGDVPYSVDSYIRSLIQAGEKGSDMIKSSVDAANALENKIKCRNGGLFILDDYKVHDVKIEVSDCFGNKATRFFKIKRDDNVFACYGKTLSESAGRMAWFMPNVVVNEEMSYSLSAGSLYKSVPVACNKISGSNPAKGIYSSVWRISSESAVLHKSGILRMAVDGAVASVNDVSKLVLARYDSNGTLSYAGGYYKNGFVTSMADFGTYCVSKDDVAPTVSAAGGSKGRFYFIVRDDFSGISSCNVHIDGNWVLSMLKNSRLTVYTADAGIASGKHVLTVTAVDNCGNETKKDFNIQL